MLRQLKPDEFQSFEGNTIRLGKSSRNHIAPKNEYQRSEFLHHYDGPKPIPHQEDTFAMKKSIYAHQRRPVEAIDNPRANENRHHSDIVDQKKQTLAKCRSEEFTKRSQQTGYNLITGEICGGGPRIEKPHKTNIGNGLGTESQRRGMQIMRDSENRYFAPQFSGEHQRYRQEVIVKEGILQPKMSGIISIGKPEAPSYGIEDQFSKNQYMEYRRPIPSKHNTCTYDFS
jgi:hypothetical protein